MSMKPGTHILSVVRKEFRHIFRDRVSCLLLFLMPAALLLLFGHALSFEIHHHDIAVCAPARSGDAERLLACLEANPAVRVSERLDDPGEIGQAFARGNTRAVVLYRSREEGIDIFLDGSAPVLAASLEMTLRSIIADYAAREYRVPVYRHTPQPVRFLYNPSLKREYTPIPGVVMMVFILISSIVLGTSVNKEKVQGSFRMLRMTRMTSGELILGKTVPYFLISLFHVAAIYLLCLHFGVRIQGSPALFFGLCILYSVCCMSLGLAISAWFDRSETVLILCWILLFIPNTFLSGFIFPVSSMPGTIRALVEFLPGTAFISAFRAIAYKGAGFAETLPWLLLLVGELVAAAGIAFFGFKRKIPR